MMSPLLENSLLDRLRNAGSVLVLTGAGMSAESGIPTFRDAQTGMWARYRPEELATPEAFQANPGRVWRWYEERRVNALAALPHAGHRALVELERLLPAVNVVTQNVDGLHQRAGSRNVVELHGSLQRFKCSVTHRPISRSWLEEAEGAPPPSPYNRAGLARPDIVWFGEVLPQEAVDTAMNLARSCEFCLSVGTTSLVHPAAGIPLLALQHGAALVEINPQETPLSAQADQCIRAPASQALSAIVEQLKPGSHSKD
ncbi:MAG: NAD-dependent deacylase [Xanthomonadales bacterium]|jgi:NAD-dependent deacetylase|nr:NAD-dependent deacylase [Xanthomonadales bacterium]